VSPWQIAFRILLRILKPMELLSPDEIKRLSAPERLALIA
jgi:hypothetical protein